MTKKRQGRPPTLGDGSIRLTVRLTREDLSKLRVCAAKIAKRGANESALVTAAETIRSALDFMASQR